MDSVPKPGPKDVVTPGAEGGDGDKEFIGGRAHVVRWQEASSSPPGEEHLARGVRGSQSHDAGWELRSLRPSRLLLLFCSINMLNYLDRGMIASNGVNGSKECQAPDPPSPSPGDGVPGDAEPCTPTGIQGEFQLTNFQDGLLPTAFLVGLLIASPLFAHSSKSHSPCLLMALGLGVWCLAVLGCAFTWGLLPLLLCRMLVGVGEASFVSLAAPCISDCAPQNQLSLFLACFYLCIPVGFALGFIYGGLVASAAGWRAAFVIEALLMLPFVLFLLRWGMKWASQDQQGLGASDESKLLGDGAAASGCIAPDMERLSSAAEPRAVESTGADSSQADSPNDSTLGLLDRSRDGDSSLVDDVLVLLHNPVYMRNILGYSAYTFVIGAYAFWAPKAMKELFQFDQADALFGAITVLTGVGGTLSGGLALDYLGSSLPTAFKLMGAVTLTGGIFCLMAFFCRSLTAFVIFIFIGELFLFAIQSPANVVAMQSVPPMLRALAIAFSTIAVHVLGDVPSPPLLGALQDALSDFRISLGVFTAVFIPAAALWYSGSWLC